MPSTFSRVPPVEDPTIERFRSAQERLLAAHGAAMRSRYVPVDGGAAHVLEAGDGPPLVLVHGGGAFAAVWAPLVQHLVPHYRVLAVDLPGSGLSTGGDYRAVHDLRAHASGFLREVLDGLDIERASLAGSSLGAWWAAAFAARHPERVDALAMIGAPAGHDETLPVFLRLLGTRGVNSLLWRTLAAPTARTIRDMYRRLLVARASSVTPELVEAQVANWRVPRNAHAWLTILERISTRRGFRRDLLLGPELPRLAMPTTVLWGDKERFGAPAAAHALTAQLPRGQLVSVREAGHLPWLDDPAAVAEPLVAYALASAAKAPARP